MNTKILFFGVATALFPLASAQPVKTTSEEPVSRIRDSQDGAIDLSRYLDEAAGFLPVINPITEPAVGYGGAVALLFLDRPDKGTEASNADFSRPNMTVIGGLLTENGTHGLLVTDIRHWLDDRLKTGVVAYSAEMNLKFYGVGNLPQLADVPLGYTWSPTGGKVNFDYRLGEESAWWAGLAYTYTVTDISFDLPAQVPPELVPDLASLTNAAVTPAITYDSRNTLFTPSKGSYLALSASLYEPNLGSDRSFQTFAATGITYLPLADDFILGLRVDGQTTSGSVPFYMKPGIDLRGVPMMSYQGDHVAQFEAEMRWQLWDRHSLVGFSGTGVAWSETNGSRSSRNATTVGIGWRYELARAFGLHAGIDVAFGPEDPAFYVTMGSAWMRP